MTKIAICYVLTALLGVSYAGNGGDTPDWLSAAPTVLEEFDVAALPDEADAPIEVLVEEESTTVPEEQLEEMPETDAEENTDAETDVSDDIDIASVEEENLKEEKSDMLESLQVRVEDVHIEPTTYQVTKCKFGQKGNDVINLQNRLKELGFTLETADGIFGKRTRFHVKEVQRYLRGKLTENFSVNGIVTDELAEVLNNPNFPVYEMTVSAGDSGEQVIRLQRRLFVLGYLGNSMVTGKFDDNTEEALQRFQRINNLVETGIADEATQKAIFTDAALDADTVAAPYRLQVDLAANTITAYEYANGKYSKVARQMRCTSGRSDAVTPRGSYEIEDRKGTNVFFNAYHAYARYITVFNGYYYIHSVLFHGENDTTPLQTAQGKLEENLSGGSIRVSEEDARWIYENCRIGTEIIID